MRTLISLSIVLVLLAGCNNSIVSPSTSSGPDLTGLPPVPPGHSDSRGYYRVNVIAVSKKSPSLSLKLYSSDNATNGVAITVNQWRPLNYEANKTITLYLRADGQQWQQDVNVKDSVVNVRFDCD